MAGITAYKTRERNNLFFKFTVDTKGNEVFK